MLTRQSDYPTKAQRKTRGLLCRGKAVELRTRFNGRSAPGGNYYPESRHYVKACNNPKGGRHPFVEAFGGIDENICEDLSAAGCKTIELRLPGAPPRYAVLDDFLRKGFSVTWNDSRFCSPRRYMALCLWYDNPSRLLERVLEIERLARREREAGRQKALF